jgi:hypothetical protein
MPASISVRDFCIISSLGGCHQIDRYRNVLLEQIGELRSCGGAIVGSDSVADVFLIPHQARGGGRQTVTTTLYINYSPAFGVSHALGWLARLLIAAAAYALMVG